MCTCVPVSKSICTSKASEHLPTLQPSSIRSSDEIPTAVAALLLCCSSVAAEPATRLRGSRVLRTPQVSVFVLLYQVSKYFCTSKTSEHLEDGQAHVAEAIHVPANAVGRVGIQRQEHANQVSVFVLLYQ